MAKRSRAKQTANQRAYAKQVKRINQFIARAEKRGYRFEADIIPQTPKRITKKAIENLKHLTPAKLYDKATTIDYDTGEIISGTEGRKNERKESARKAQETRQRKAGKSTSYDNYSDSSDSYYPNGGDIIYGNVVEDFIMKLQEPISEEYVNRWGRKARRQASLIHEVNQAKTTLLSLVQMAIDTVGKAELGWRLEANADEVYDCTNYLLYASSSSEGIQSATSRLASIINGGALTMEQLKDLAEQDEYNEAWGGELFNE